MRAVRRANCRSFTQGSMWFFLGVSNGVSRARWVKLANRQAGHLSSLRLIRTWCSTGILLCEARGTWS